MKKMSRSLKQFWIAVILILVGSIFACLLQTNFFRTKVKDLYIMGDNQSYLHALMFVPKSASAENKVPCVVTSHGWLNSAEVQDAASIELSRRGVAVIAIDATNHGMSSNRAPEDGCMGMIQYVEYVTSDCVDFIDVDKIGVMGHSMGGFAANNTVDYYGTKYFEAIEAAQAEDSDGGTEITEAEQAYADAQYKIDAALPTGNGPNVQDGKWDLVRCNYGVLFGYYEEGGYTNSTGKANVLGSTPEALSLANSVDPSVTYVESGKYYGNKEDHTLRVLYQPYITHPLIHFDPVSTANVISFWTYVWDLDTDLGPYNQTFLIKEVFNLVAMVGLLLILTPTADFLLSTPLFASLRGKEGPKVPALSGDRKKKFWFGWALCGIVSFVTAIISTYTFDLIPWPLDPFTKGTLFAAPSLNLIVEWTVFNAIFGFFWFFWNYKKDKAAGIRNDDMIGWKISWKEFWKSLGLTVAILAFMYAIVWFCKWLFNTDFRFWTPAIKTFNADKLITYIQYWPIFFAFYLANSLLVNGAMRVEGMSERKNLLICGIGNILGCGAMWFIQYSVLLATGAVLWKAEWCNVLCLFFCIWQLFFAPYFERRFYQLTGKNWVGALVVSSVYVLSSVTNTAIHAPWF